MEQPHMKILSESESEGLQIVQFRECGHIGLRYQNILLTFTGESFEQFVKSYNSIDFDRHSIVFPDHQNRLIMNTVVDEVQFCFTYDEFESLQQALSEASLILQAHSLLHN